MLYEKKSRIIQWKKESISYTNQTEAESLYSVTNLLQVGPNTREDNGVPQGENEHRQVNNVERTMSGPYF